MAQVIGNRTRGRRKEPLRLTVTELIMSALKPSGAAQDVTIDLREVEVAGPKGSKKTVMDNVTLSIPKGSVLVPFALTSEKSEENAREQIRNAKKDAEEAGFKAPKGLKVQVQSTAVKLADDSEAVVWTVHLAKDEG